MCFLDSKNSVRHYQFGERKKNYQFGHSLNIWISWILTTYSFFLNIMYCIFANAQLILDPQPYQGFALKYKVNISTPCSYLLSKWSHKNHRQRGDWLMAQQDCFWILLIISILHQQNWYITPISYEGNPFPPAITFSTLVWKWL